MDKQPSVKVIAVIAVVIVVTAGVFLCKAYRLAWYQDTNTAKQGGMDVQMKSENSGADKVEEESDSKLIVLGRSLPVTALNVSDKNEVTTWKIYRDPKFSFTFRYPKTWFQDGRRLNDEKIVDSAIGSHNAPISFGAYSVDAAVFLKADSGILPFDHAQKMKALEAAGDFSTVSVGEVEFNRYEWIDKGQYEGVSSGKQILYVTTVKDEEEYLIAFQWSEFVPSSGDLSGKLMKTTVDEKTFTDVVATFEFYP